MPRRRIIPVQQTLPLPQRGGRRVGAGRPATRERPALPHASREEVRAGQPVHVTLRFTDAVWNLRSERSFAVIHGALSAARARQDARITHFSVQGNHIHLVVEATGTVALSNAIRSLSIRLAKRLNRMMGRRGPVFENRFHAHVLRTPAEVRNALRYVVGNFASHAARRDERVRDGWVDPYSSAAVRAPRSDQPTLFAAPVVRPPRTWLLRNAVRPEPATVRAWLPAHVGRRHHSPSLPLQARGSNAAADTRRVTRTLRGATAPREQRGDESAETARRRYRSRFQYTSSSTSGRTSLGIAPTRDQPCRS